MILYRSIGYAELVELTSGKIINAKYNIGREKLSTANIEKAVCFFVDEYWWVDKQHTAFIKVNIPKERLVFGIGTYYAPKRLAETRIWSGRRGTETYQLKEAYALKYSLKDIVEIAVNKKDEHLLRDLNIKRFKLPEISKNNSENAIKVEYSFKYNITPETEYIIKILKTRLKGLTNSISVSCLSTVRIDYELNKEKLINYRHVLIIKGNVIQYNLINKYNSNEIFEYYTNITQFEQYLINEILN